MFTLLRKIKDFGMNTFIFIFILATSSTLARKGFGPTDQDWGYITVRPGAHMFWWLQHTSADVASYTERPLVIWLQGGPGGSSTGYGNFEELGPLDVDLNVRNTTWIKEVNVLFVDNPVGTGFSYVDSYEALAKTNKQIADDFLALLQNFYQKIPELTSTPLYIFCESYGGKMTAEIALTLDKAIIDGVLNVNLKGVGLGDAWISPIDSVLSWGQYLLNMGVVDQNGFERIQNKADQTKEAINNGEYSKATDLWAAAEAIIETETYNVDFYNILTKIESNWKRQQPLKLWKPSLRDAIDKKIEIIMNNQVKEALQLNSTFGQQSGLVFHALRGDFMKPVTDIVELLLNTTNIKVAVYNGQLDLIVDTPGTIAWVDKLRFEGADEWRNASRLPMIVDGIVEGYLKKVDNLAMYWVNRAGHMVPLDNPAAMWYILDDVTNSFS